MQYKSKTYRVITGCGNLYVTIDYNEDSSFHRMRMQRNSKMKCSLTLREALARDATYKLRRDGDQFIKDHKGEICEMNNMKVKVAKKKGEIAGTSCSDGVACLVEKILNEKKEEETNQTNKM